MKRSQITSLDQLRAIHSKSKKRNQRKFIHTEEKGKAEGRKKGEPYWNKPWISKGGHNSRTGYLTDKEMKRQDQALKDLDERKCVHCGIKFKNHGKQNHDWESRK